MDPRITRLTDLVPEWTAPHESMKVGNSRPCAVRQDIGSHVTRFAGAEHRLSAIDPDMACPFVTLRDSFPLLKGRAVWLVLTIGTWMADFPVIGKLGLTFVWLVGSIVVGVKYLTDDEAKEERKRNNS